MPDRYVVAKKAKPVPTSFDPGPIESVLLETDYAVWDRHEGCWLSDKHVYQAASAAQIVADHANDQYAVSLIHASSGEGS